MKQALYILFLLIQVSGNTILSQENTDSLKRILSGTYPDSTKLKACNYLFNSLRESKPDLAKNYALKGISIAEKIGDPKMEGKLCHNLGTFYYFKADYPLALHYTLRALDIRERLKDTINLVKSLNNIGLIYYEENNQEEALNYHNKSLAIKERMNDRPGMASSYGNIGNAYFKKAQAAKSDSLFILCSYYHSKAKAIQSELSLVEPENIYNLVGLAATYNNLGNVDFERSLLHPDNALLSSAVDNHFKALEIQTKIDDVRGLGHSYINIAGIYERLRKSDAAISYYEKALKYSKETDDKESMKACYDGLSNTYEHLGDYKNSLRYYKLFNGIKDSIWNDTKSEQLAEMQTKYESDKKNREIELLNKNQILHQNVIEKQSLQRNSAIIGFVLVLIIVFVLYNRYRIKSISGKKLEAQNTIIGEKNKEITDSIKYAKRIQEAILPPQEYINSLIPENFIFYKPKDIVSGDFYWVDNIDNKIYIAAVDCTGHGVPGAFISIVGFNLLKHAIHEHNKTKPSDILDQINRDLSESLRITDTESNVKDGMDISLCCYDLKSMELQYAGANNSIYIVSRNEVGALSLKEYKADKQPIGNVAGSIPKPFTNNIIQLHKGDMIYQFTDGFADQFGGPKGKKFKYKSFEELLTLAAAKPANEQKEIVSSTHDTWKGSLEQVDDILVLGIRI